MQVRLRDAIYARAESVAKDILDGYPPGVFHRHRQSQVSALTIGYVRDLWIVRDSRLGVGGDLTGFLVPDNLARRTAGPSPSTCSALSARAR